MSGRRFQKQRSQPATTTTTSITRIEASAFSGPLPHPDILARYNEVVPNGADRIFAAFERQGLHRESLEASVVRGNIKSQNQGSWFGFIVSMTAVIGGIYLIAIGKQVSGLATIVANLAALAGIFVYVRQKQKSELTAKSTALEKRQP